jgi:YD repeat-containing protein
MPARLRNRNPSLRLSLSLAAAILPMAFVEPATPGRHIQPAPLIGVSVTPDGSSTPQRPPYSGGYSEVFTVKNTSGATATFNLTCWGGTPNITCTGQSHSVVTLLNNESVTVTAWYSVGSPGGGSGQLRLSAESETAFDTGTWNVVIGKTVAVAPDGAAAGGKPANTGGYSESFTVQNTSGAQLAYSLSCSGSSNTTCTGLSQASLTLAAGQQQSITAFYSVGAAGTGTLAVTAASADDNDPGSYSIPVVNPAASVTPDGASTTIPENTPTSYSFTVTNTGSVRTPYDLAAVCTGSGVTGCAASPSSITLDPANSQGVAVSFTTGGGGTSGVVELRAQVAGTVLDAGTVNVTVRVAPVVDAASVNPEAVLARDQCLAIALAPAAASECGDLRIVHPLPSVRTMNVWRTPALVYNSAQATGWVSVAANVTLPANGVSPSTITAALRIAGVTRASGSWAGSQWSPGAVRRIALGFSGPAAGLTTGSYDYVLEVTNAYPESNHSTTVTGKLIIVDRTASYFGAGWWLAGLERWDPSTGLWIGGDGSARQYVLRPGSAPPFRVWGALSVTYPDSIREAGAEFVRDLPDSVRVFFDAQGRHVRTQNRQRHVTTFGYDGSGRLTTITLPPAASPLSYSLSYDAYGRIARIDAPGVPATRTTILAVDPATGRLTAITEPDGRVVRFSYGSDHKIASRTDRRGTVTDFQYDAGGRVSQATVNLTPGTITRTLQQAPSRGFAGTSVPLDQVFTRLDGPRAVNTRSFYLNRFGAPDSIIDALGQRTRLARGDARFLGLVTQLVTVTGHTVSATYDSRGRILTSSEPSTSGTIATTTYQWDTRWDQVTRITNPEGDFLEFGLDPATGNRTWQQDGRGSISRTTFTYNADNQIESVCPPGLGCAYSYGYDAKGNLASYFSALDRRFTWTNNAIGLTTEIRTPTGPCCRPGWDPHQIETIQYSVRNEDTLRTVSLADQSITVRRRYDEEGNLLELTRTFTPNPAGIAPLVTSWQYDRANRPVVETQPDGTSERRWFDAAGNLDSVITRRGFKIAMSYDPLDRLSTRLVPQITINLPPSEIYPATGVNQLPYTYTWSADAQSFEYYPDGQIRLAINKDAAVTRTFHPSGRLLSEQLVIRTTDRGGVHSYLTSYTYDRNGRRTSLTAPSLFAGQAIQYTYDPLWGALTSVTDIAGNRFSFGYNERSELTRVTYGGGIVQTLSYDSDGRLSADVLTNPGGKPSCPNRFPYFPCHKVRHFQVTNRNARDQILSSTDSILADQVAASYSGLGYVESANLRQFLVNGVTGAPVKYAAGDSLTYDGLGNLVRAVLRDSAGAGRSPGGRAPAAIPCRAGSRAAPWGPPPRPTPTTPPAIPSSSAPPTGSACPASGRPTMPPMSGWWPPTPAAPAGESSRNTATTPWAGGSGSASSPPASPPRPSSA